MRRFTFILLDFSSVFLLLAIHLVGVYVRKTRAPAYRSDANGTSLGGRRRRPTVFYGSAFTASIRVSSPSRRRRASFCRSICHTLQNPVSRCSSSSPCVSHCLLPSRCELVVFCSYCKTTSATYDSDESPALSRKWKLWVATFMLQDCVKSLTMHQVWHD